MSLIEGYRKLVRTITVTAQTFLESFQAPMGLEPTKSLGFGAKGPQASLDSGQMGRQANRIRCFARIQPRWLVFRGFGEGCLGRRPRQGLLVG
jgi:hypothetical protein